MSSTTYTSVHLAKRPKGDIVPGETFSLKKFDAPKESDLHDGEVLLQVLYLSLDPAMRGWLNGELKRFLHFFILLMTFFPHEILQLSTLNAITQTDSSCLQEQPLIGV